MHRTAAIAVALSALLAISTVACGGSSDGGSAKETTTTSMAGGAAPSKDVDVKISDFAFGPQEVKVDAGGTVTFTNSDDTTHTATADSDTPASFDTGKLGRGDSKTVTFDEPGVYEYECSIHEYMKGTVRVIG